MRSPTAEADALAESEEARSPISRTPVTATAADKHGRHHGTNGSRTTRPIRARRRVERPVAHGAGFSSRRMANGTSKDSTRWPGRPVQSSFASRRITRQPTPGRRCQSHFRPRPRIARSGARCCSSMRRRTGTRRTRRRTKFNDANDDYVGTRSRNAALFFPRLRQPNPLRDDQLETFAACGAVAGIYRAHRHAARRVESAGRARRDARRRACAERGAHRRRERRAQSARASTACAPFPQWGAWSGARARCAAPTSSPTNTSTFRSGARRSTSRRACIRGRKWVVFEPNDEPLWAQIRLNVGAFMHNLFRQGAFQGTTPRDAYFVKCDKETTTQNDINLGIVNIVVGFAPLKPAEFVDHQAPADGRPDRRLRPLTEESKTPWHSSPSTRSASIPTRTSNSA